MKPVSLLCFALLVLPSAAQRAAAQQPEPFERLSANIALHMPYTLTPTPAYAYCTDPGDKEQLTDGVYTEGHFWTQPSTVGWSGVKPAIITIDLGAVKAVRGVSFNTAAGLAGVEWPQSILIFVADEADQFHLVGDLVDLSAKKSRPLKDGYAYHRFWTDELKTHGRFIGLAVIAEPYTFVDEIEVYEGDASWVNEPLPGAPCADVKTFVSRLTIRDSVARRMRQDMQSVTDAAADPAIPEAARADIMAEVDVVRGAIGKLPLDFGPDFKTILPLNAAHELLFRANARIWELKGLKPLTVWQSGLWDFLPLFAMPDAKKPAEINMRMMGGEYRAASLNLSSAANEPMTLALKFAGLPGGTCPPYIGVHSVEWTDTSRCVPVAAALPDAEKQGDAYLLHVPAGMTRQVWFTFHAVDVPAGDYAGKLDISGQGQERSVPVALKIYPMQFPAKPTLHMGGWDYTDVAGQYTVTPENRAALVAHLREHFVDSPWGTAALLPLGKYDNAGKMIEPPDTAHFDQWLELWPSAGQYCVFASVGKKLREFEPGTPAFDEAVKAWVTFWAEHAKAKGLKPEQLAVLLVDEPSTAEADASILAWAKPFRAANTGIRIWEDPIHDDMAQANIEAMRAAHVLCPNRPTFVSEPPAFREYFADRKREGTRLDFYSCSGPARLLDPYAYYRMQAWDCWRYGAESTFFWAFGDGGGASSWNEYLVKNAAYTPLFLDDKTVVAGKEMEACRESIEDYEYLVMLRDAIAKAEMAKTDPALLARAKTLLQDGPTRVSESALTNKSFMWGKEMDRTVADAVRLEILEVVAAL